MEVDMENILTTKEDLLEEIACNTRKHNESRVRGKNEVIGSYLRSLDHNDYMNSSPMPLSKVVPYERNLSIYLVHAGLIGRNYAACVSKNDEGFEVIIGKKRKPSILERMVNNEWCVNPNKLTFKGSYDVNGDFVSGHYIDLKDDTKYKLKPVKPMGLEFSYA